MVLYTIIMDVVHLKAHLPKLNKNDIGNCFVSKNIGTAGVLGSAKTISLRAQLFWRTIAADFVP